MTASVKRWQGLAMAGEWPTVALGGYVTKIGSGATPRGGSEVYLDQGPFALIRSQNVLDFQFKHSGLVFIDDEQARQLDGVTVQDQDILLNITGDSVARVCMVDPAVLPARVNQHVAIVRAEPKHFDQRFLFYVLAAPAWKQLLLTIAGSGATRNALTKGDLGRLGVPKPSIRLQEAIANLLASLDDKIELNRRMAATLEEMARALFKSWFVDFDPVRAKVEGNSTGLPAATAGLFPSRFGEEGLPEGWVLGSVADILEVNPSTPLRVGTHAPYVEMAALPSAGPSISGFITRDASSGSRFQRDDTLVARITPCLENGKTALVDFLPEGQIGWGSTEFIVLRPRTMMSRAWPYLLARYEPFRAHLIGAMTGSSGRQRVPPSAVAAWEMALPPSEVLSAFASIIDPIFTSITAAAQESSNLHQLRDTLLPKLISGELRIKDTKNAVEAA